MPEETTYIFTLKTTDIEDDYINLGSDAGFFQLWQEPQDISLRDNTHAGIECSIDPGQKSECERFLAKMDVEDDYINFTGDSGFLQLQLLPGAEWAWAADVQGISLNMKPALADAAL